MPLLVKHLLAILELESCMEEEINNSYCIAGNIGGQKIW